MAEGYITKAMLLVIQALRFEEIEMRTAMKGFDERNNYVSLSKIAERVESVLAEKSRLYHFFFFRLKEGETVQGRVQDELFAMSGKHVELDSDAWAFRLTDHGWRCAANLPAPRSLRVKDTRGLSLQSV